VCRNRADVPMALADAAVLDVLATDLLDPAVIDAAIVRAVERVAAKGRPEDGRQRLEAELKAARQEVERLVAAVRAGADVPAFVDALKAADSRGAARGRLGRAPAPQPREAPAALRRRARAVVNDWQAVLTRRAPQARRMMRALLVGRLSFRPDGVKRWTFSGTGTLRGMLGRRAAGGLPRRWRPHGVWR
jgi:hypothetical protein